MWAQLNKGIVEFTLNMWNLSVYTLPTKYQHLPIQISLSPRQRYHLSLPLRYASCWTTRGTFHIHNTTSSFFSVILFVSVNFFSSSVYYICLQLVEKKSVILLLVEESFPNLLDLSLGLVFFSIWNNWKTWHKYKFLTIFRYVKLI